MSSKQVVLITGASTGLGLALAKLLLEQRSYRLILTARERSLRRFAKEGIYESAEVWLRPLEVTDAAQRVTLIEEANARWGGVDILINNAGISYRSVVEHVTEEERLEQMDINFRSPMELIRLVLPSMRAKRRGHIINVSSVGGMMAMPTMAVYSASKFALEGASEALWYELRPWGIRVTLIQPGFINSSSFKKVRLTKLSQHAIEDPESPYYGHYQHMSSLIERLMGWALATPESISRKILKTLRQSAPPLRVPVTLDAFLFHWLRRLLPRSWYHLLLYYNLPKIWRWGPQKPTPTPLAEESLEFAPPVVLELEGSRGGSGSFVAARHGLHSPHTPLPVQQRNPYTAAHALKGERIRLL